MQSIVRMAMKYNLRKGETGFHSRLQDKIKILVNA
jgi:hypothetical protein